MQFCCLEKFGPQDHAIFKSISCCLSTYISAKDRPGPSDIHKAELRGGWGLETIYESGHETYVHQVQSSDKSFLQFRDIFNKEPLDQWPEMFSYDCSTSQVLPKDSGQSLLTATA